MKAAAPVMSDEAAARRRRAMGQAIRDAREGKGMTQVELGAEIGDIPQTTISRWEKGLVDLTAEQILALEVALGIKAGGLWVTAGYGTTDLSTRDVETILRQDQTLHPDLRANLVAAYKSYVAVSKKLHAAELRQRRR